jgi:hypothetical protein
MHTDIEPARPICSRQASSSGRCVNVGEDLHIVTGRWRRGCSRASNPSPFCILWFCLGATEPTAVAEDRSASRTATAPGDLHNEDPRSHFTTATGERCPCAMRLRATAAIAATYPYTACRITVSRSAASMYDRRRWLWRLLSCRMQDIVRLLCLDGTASL